TVIAIFLPVLQALECFRILTERAAFNSSCDGCPLAKQTVLRRAVRVCHGSGRESRRDRLGSCSWLCPHRMQVDSFRFRKGCSQDCSEKSPLRNGPTSLLSL